MSDEATPPRERSAVARAARILLLTIVIAVVVVVLFTTVFPWVEERTQVPTIGAGWPSTAWSVSD